MLNSVMLIGRLKDFQGNSLLISISRAYKNEKGKYETDELIVRVPDGIAKNVKKYCNRGAVIGIKGRVSNGNVITAEKITFLSTSKKK